MVSSKELYQWRDRAKQAAIAASIDPIEVDWLLQEVGKINSLQLRLLSATSIADIPIQKPLWQLDCLWQRRLAERIPLQYLTGIAPWRNFDIQVTPDVLIPRPETELLIDLVAKIVQENSRSHLASGDWVDLGTGSGAIAIGLADCLPQATIHAVDYSLAAIKIAQSNADRLGFIDRIQFYQGSWWQPLERMQGKLSGMVSNPPYIPSREVLQLQPEVVQHEPHLALDGGENGLDCIKYLVITAPKYLQSGGIWLVEMMAGQAQTVIEMLEKQGSYEKSQIISDLAGIERFALAYRR